MATEETLGGVKAAAAGEDDTVEVKIGDDSKLYVQALAAATDETLGGVIADEATEDDTVEVKIGEDIGCMSRHILPMLRSQSPDL